MTPRNETFRDGQGGSLGNHPDPIPMPDSPTGSCCPSDIKYETGTVKGWKQRVEDGDPEVLLKHVQWEKGKGKRKEDLGTVDKIITVGP